MEASNTNSNTTTENKKSHIIPKDSPIMEIIAEKEFNLLEPKEQSYAYNLLLGCWEGTKICFFQKSWESPALFYILQSIFTTEPLNSLREKCFAKHFSQEEWEMLVRYCAAFIQNCGNYKSFGDIKFVPEISEEKFKLFIECSQACTASVEKKEIILNLWNTIKRFIFRFEAEYKFLGIYPNGLNGFYSYDLTKDEILIVDDFLQNEKKISPLNTRIGKLAQNEYAVLIASGSLQKENNSSHKFKNSLIHLVYGDYSPFLLRIAQHFENAKRFAANENQSQMLQLYVEHFKSGNVNTHKDSQRVWVKDISPVIESNIGFIETYLDPMGVRAEFEGWVAVVDKEQSKKTASLVDKADILLNKLSPWPKDFEKDKFLKPDFTSLSVLAFGCGGTPLGINIPNYDDIRQTDGFKNVHLGNCVLSLKKINYLQKPLADILLKHHKDILFFKVAFHELLGHGCGKLFMEDANGKKNFDYENLINPITKQKIESWYKPEETWGSVFGKMSNPYEECRADSVALYYSCFEESYDVLLPELKKDWKALNAGCFAEFLLQGINALEYYNLQTKSFTQAHMNGRFVILQVLLEAGNGFVKIEKCQNAEEGGKDWISASLDAEQILTTGKTAMSNFLLKMNVFKATADFKHAAEMYQGYSQVNEFFLSLREIVLANKRPVRVELQGYVLQDESERNGLKYLKFQDNFEGVIDAFTLRFPEVDEEVLRLWREQQKYFKPLPTPAGDLVN